MNETEEIAIRIRSALPHIKRGALRLWGERFGRPYDNIHILVRCDTHKNCLRLFFHQAETLLIWSPQGLLINESTFQIIKAPRLRWEWFFYGHPRTAANLRFMEFEKSSLDVIISTSKGQPTRKPIKSQIAVEIV